MNATPIRFVIVTMDSALAGSAARTQLALRAELPGLELVVHAADEWGNDPEALTHCRDDIARGDIVLAAMLSLDDHIRAVQPALAARRDGCDAMIGLMSGTEITPLTRIGKFAMDKEATGITAMLKKLKPKSAQKGGKSSGRAQMKMVKQLPKLLRFIPGTAQDARSYVLTLQYWLGGSEENFANLVRRLVNKYSTGERAAAAAKVRALPPVEYPDMGLYHPRLAGRVTENFSDLPRAGEKGTIGLLVLRSYILSANSRHYDGVIDALEVRGLNVVPAFASGLDRRVAIEAYFKKDGVTSVDAVISLTGFSLVGGPAYNDAQAAEDVLARLDVPYIGAHPVEFQPSKVGLLTRAG